MIRVTIHPPSGPTTVVDIVNAGPVAPDEGWDPGGERLYTVWLGDEAVGAVRHFRRDGLIPLVIRALQRLPE